MKASEKLQQYRKKRNFQHTTEPRGDSPSRSGSALRYVIQKHAARRLHYDFRLELDGTLKSWAVPKGPSLNPSEKRLAMHVEDHPMEYADFEGIIPPRQYGAGTVMVWDRGQWIPDGDPKAAYEKGHLKFRLEGQKLQGRWTLVRMGGARNREENSWLLIKERDEAARTAMAIDSTPALSNSVKSGMSMDEIAVGRPAEWHSDRATDRRAGSVRKEFDRTIHRRGRPQSRTGGEQGGERTSCPEWMEPQLATLVDEPPKDEGWLYELKYDGYRMLCRISNGAAELFSRNGLEWTAKLADHAKAAAGLRVVDAWLDGEIVALAADGTMSFQALQNAFDGARAGRLVYFVFDLLFLDGNDLRGMPLHERKRKLSALLAGQPEDGLLRYSDHIREKGRTVFEAACRQGLEGLIAKQTDSQYLPGRNRNWIKLKCHRRQEFVIGGFTDPTGSRRGFGALLLGVYEGKGNLVYVGRVGTGFSEERLSRLHHDLRSLQQSKPAFMKPPTGADAKGVHWVKPELVAEVRFAGWTQEGLLRQASFVGMRRDKPAGVIVRESPAPVSASRLTGDRREDEAVRTPNRPSSRARRIQSPHETQKRTGTTTVAGIKISNPYRVLFPHDGITKLEFAQFYERIADWILPQLRGRPLTLVRCPDGHGTGCFYQKHVTDQVHEAIDRVEVEEADGPACYMVANTPAALVALVQLGVLEFHTWGATQDRLDQPDRMILDLDPAPDVPWHEAVEAARLIRTLLAELSLAPFVKTTGGKGLHVVVPLERRHSWDEVKQFARSLAGHMVHTFPARFTDNMSKRTRKGKVYLDYLRNGRGATAVAAYSTRAKPRAPISVPLTWDECSPELRSDRFTLHNIEERLSRLTQDPWAEYATVHQHLTANMTRRLAGP
ncbi:MAG: ATP-dependent DNA ligase clustered with Ku protein, LigD [Nitrospira sp.]|jgi:bifunctional non-homologous end joining protein LigD|nr:MAG: ATP-dependent DNA ligase clustered with Ku protein, LigD [Nitrospira sp.]